MKTTHTVQGTIDNATNITEAISMLTSVYKETTKLSIEYKEEAVMQMVIKEKPIVGIDCPKCNRRIHTDYIRNTVTYAQCSRCMWRFAWDTSDGTFDPKKIIVDNDILSPSKPPNDQT